MLGRTAQLLQPHLGHFWLWDQAVASSKDSSPFHDAPDEAPLSEYENEGLILAGA